MNINVKGWCWEAKETLSKMIQESVLDETRWFGVHVGSCIVSYCEDCNCQRTMTCTDRYRIGDDRMLVFLCDHCRFSVDIDDEQPVPLSKKNVNIKSSKRKIFEKH